MKRQILAAALVLIGAHSFTSAAFAADRGGYIGVSIGQAQAKDLKAGDIDADFASIGLGTSTTVDDKDTAFKIFGGYKFNPNFAVEVAYADFGKAKFNSTVISGGAGTLTGNWTASSFNAAALGILPVGSGFDIFGKAGIGIYDAKLDLTASGPGGTLSSSDSKTGVYPLLGIGAIYNFSNFGIRAEWERHLNVGDNDTTGQSDVDVFSIGLQIHF